MNATIADFYEIHYAIRTTDWRGCIFQEDVTDYLEPGITVRISMIDKIKKDQKSAWFHDSPYLKVIEVDQVNGKLLGQVRGINRKKNVNKYPVQTGERLWINWENVIEIPIQFVPKEKQDIYKNMLTDEFLPITGPLFTTQYQKNKDDTDSDSDDDSYITHSCQSTTDNSATSDDDVTESEEEN